MRYFATTTSPYAYTVTTSWHDYGTVALNLNGTPVSAIRIGCELARFFGDGMSDTSLGKAFGFFISYSSKYACWEDLKLVLQVVEQSLLPSEKAVLVKARIYYQRAHRLFKYERAFQNGTPYGNFIAADLTRGSVVCVTHIVHV